MILILRESEKKLNMSCIDFLEFKMIKKIIDKTATASLMAAGVLGIAWLVNRALIEFLKMKTIEYDVKSKQPDLHPATQRYYENQVRDFDMMVEFSQKAYSLHPLTIAGRYGKHFSERYFGGNGHK